MRRRASAWREAVSGPGRALLAMGILVLILGMEGAPWGAASRVDQGVDSLSIPVWLQ